MSHIALVSTVLRAGYARAAETTPAGIQADELVHRALDLRRQGDNAGAVGLLRRAEELAPSGRIIAQLGFAEFAVQHWVEAESDFERALASSDSWLANPKNREMLNKTLGETRRHVGHLAVSGTTGAEISLNGKPAGSLPMTGPIAVPAGTVRVTARASGRKEFEKVLVVAGGEDVAVAINLEPIAPPPPPVNIAPISARSGADTAAAPAWRRWTGGGLFVAGVAAVGTGIAWVVLDGRTNCTPPAGGICQQVYDTKTQGWVADRSRRSGCGDGATLFLWKRGEAPAWLSGPVPVRKWPILTGRAAGRAAVSGAECDVEDLGCKEGSHRFALQLFQNPGFDQTLEVCFGGWVRDIELLAERRRRGPSAT